ncbi:MAG: ATP-grasp domain-containing protein [Nitrososphaerales archaeon]|nr:ATP-grasp domain-containing protein [Nitrososphaerales archaeon]
MKVAIFEYLSGGGLSGKVLPSSILSEGYGMLRSVLTDFKDAGYKTSTLLDSRLSMFQPPLKADDILSVDSLEELKVRFMDLLEDSDASLLIAPESEGILAKFLSFNRELGIDSLNCTIDSIETVSNKSNLYEKLEERGLPIPETELVRVEEGFGKVQNIIEEMNFPLIIKPINGTGCQGLSIVRKPSQLPLAINRIKEEAMTGEFLIQKFVVGVHASVSLISNGKEAVPLTLNLQILDLNTPDKISSYIGGLVPLDHKLRKEALHTAKKAVEIFRGLVGYIGVDLVLSKIGPILIEINPRLTVSYIGLRMVSNLNLAEAIVKASLDGKLPENFDPSGYSAFSKETLPIFSNDSLKGTYSMKEVVTPPFPLNEENYAILATKGDNPKKAKDGLQKVKHRLMSMVE